MGLEHSFFLGFSQIICYYSYKMVRWARLVIGLTIMFLTLGIREALYFGKDINPVIAIIYFWEKFGKSFLSLDWIFRKVGGKIMD